MPKAICPECSKENDKRMFKNPYFNQQLLEKDKLINELLEKVEELERHCKTHAATLDHCQAGIKQLEGK